MMRFLILAITVGCFAAFGITLSDKWGIREWLEVHADYYLSKIFPSYDGDLLNRLFRCNFCVSWWCGVIISLTLSITMKDWQMIFIPFVSTMITRKLL